MSNQPSWPAELYAQARPDYPAPIIKAVLDAPASSAPLHIVDIGAGTGISSRLLIEGCRKDAEGHHRLASITSLDAAPNMLKELSRILYEPGGLVHELQSKGQLDSDIKTSTGISKFEDFYASKFGLEGKVDLITIAQAWHWCSDWERSLSNMANALRPGGVLAIFWNLEDRNAATWVAEVRDAYEQYENDTPQYRHKYWHAMYKTEAIKRFDVLPPQKATRLLPTTVDVICNRIKSKSYVSVLAPEKQEELCQAVRQYFESTSDQELQRRWIDKEQGVFEYPYTTDLFMFRKK